MSHVDGVEGVSTHALRLEIGHSSQQGGPILILHRALAVRLAFWSKLSI
jgi:hypothetical protein